MWSIKLYYQNLFNLKNFYSNSTKQIIVRKMQTSIKMFFKARQASQGDGDKECAVSATSNQKNSELEQKEDGQNKSENTHADIEITDENVIKKDKAPKRSAEGEEDSDDEWMKKSIKRQAVSPANQSLSSKRKIIDDSDEEEEKSDEVKVEIIEKPVKSAAISAPSQQKSQNSSQEENKPKLTPAFAASPLMDLSVVIRKKISSGSSALHENIGTSWFRALQSEFDKPYFKKLSSFVQQERQSKTVFPPEEKVYSWTHHHDIKDTRVVILGQDPYFNPRQAHGLSFSVQKGIKPPPSLMNIYKELESDIEGFKPPMDGTMVSGDLTGWAKQGVLMLNTCLTVNQGQANSHQGKGWETFTDAVIQWLSKNLKHKAVFMLWGRPAQKKSNTIDKRHKLLTAAHPSPLSAHNGFFGCGHFSKTNTFLREQGLPEINWKSL